MQQDNIPQGCLPFDLEKALAGHPVSLYGKKDLIANVTEIIKLSTLGCPFPVIIVTENDLKSGAFNESGEAYDCYYRLYLKKPEPKKVKVWIPICTKASEFEWRIIPPCESLRVAKEAIANHPYTHLRDEKYWQIIEAEIEVSE